MAITGSLLAIHSQIKFDKGSLAGGIAASSYVGNAALEMLPFDSPNCICPPCSREIALPPFSVYVKENAEFLNSQCDGAIAVGGNATFSRYSVGNAVNKTADNLLVEQDLSFSNGNVNGNVIVGGSASFVDASYSSISYRPTGINFVDSFALLEASSQYVSNMEPNGIVLTNSNFMQLEGVSPTLNIFRLSPDALAPITNLNVSAPAQSWVIINIGGAISKLSNIFMQVSVIDKQRVLWNLYETSQLHLENINLLGSLLAPQATVQFSQGSLNGNLLCNSLENDGGFFAFNPWVPFVPPCLPCDC